MEKVERVTRVQGRTSINSSGAGRVNHTVVITLVQVDCFKCHAIFGMTKVADAHKRRSHEDLWCPCCGAQQAYGGKSDLERLREDKGNLERSLVRERARHDQTRADRNVTKRRLSATRGVITRTKNRIANGVCPCCNRQFQNLANHIANKHPDYRERTQ